LFRYPVFTLSAVAVLALGMGATTAIYTLVRGLLLEPLAIPNASRAVWIRRVAPQSSASVGLTYTEFVEFQEMTRSFEKMSALYRATWNMTGEGQPERLQGARVATGFLDTLGVRPYLGRSFRPAEYHVGSDNVALISYALWQRRFGGDRDVLGRRMMLDGVPQEIAGVLPPGLPLVEEYDLIEPFPVESGYAKSRNARLFWALGRLKPGISLDQARAESGSIAAELVRRQADSTGYGFHMTTFPDRLVGDVRPTLWAFAAAVGCLLLIACSNVASLLLARGAGRIREMGVRAAVGASRGRLTRQLMVESGLLALIAGGLAYPLAVESVRLLLALDPHALPRAGQIHAGLGVMAFCFLLSLVAAAVFGAAPAWRVSSVDVQSVLRDGGRSGTPGREGNRLRSALVVLEVALGLALLTTAGLMARSFRQLTLVEPGWDPSRVVTMQIGLTNARYRESAPRLHFFETLLAQIERMPDVVAAGGTNILPLEPYTNATGVWTDAQPEKTPADQIQTDLRVITPGYFRAMGVRLVQGRVFTWSDQGAQPRVTILNQAFARERFPGGALGRHIFLDAGNGPIPLQIVGVVADYHEASLAQGPLREMFVSYGEAALGSQMLAIRTRGDPMQVMPAVRAAMTEIDPDVPLYDLRTMREQVRQSIAVPRLRSALLAVFSAVAMILAALGLYGLIACSVAERKREIGIRVALGARPEEVRWMVVKHGLKLTALGLAGGLVGSAVAARLLRGLLFGVSAADPVTYLGASTLFLGVALLASYLPAYKATRTDPMIALREE
jgi:putative ABC transport system permease protein